MRLDSDTWRTFFDSFERDAFRLETLQIYDMTSEREEYETFLTTGELRIPSDDPWLTRVRRFRETGRSIERVHVITRPLTDYLHYEFAVYAHTTAAGEDVRIFDLTNRSNPGLPQEDFWLFDDRHVVRMDYDQEGRQLGRELLEDVDPTPYVAWKLLALEHSVPFTEYRVKLEP